MYTVEIYRKDARTKAGERLVLKKDYDTDNKSTLEKTVKDSLQKNERYEIHETYVTRTSLVGGKEFQERYDTPYYCSPSSETYWIYKMLLLFIRRSH
jgi:hypothetical protein